MQQDVAVSVLSSAPSVLDTSAPARTLPRWVWEPLAVLAITILVPAMFLSAQRLLGSVRTAPAWNSYEQFCLDKPLSIRPLVEPLFAPGSQEYEAIQEILRNPPPTPLDGPVAIHLLRAYPHSRIPRPDISSASDVRALFTGVGLGNPNYQSPIIRTRQGARFQRFTGNKAVIDLGENHRDAFLATLAEVGVPLSTPLHVPPTSTAPGSELLHDPSREEHSGGPIELRISDVLRDSLAAFNLEQPEIEWSAVALTLYMPTATAWWNRDGEQFTCDALAAELLRRDLSKASCGGTHLLMAMTLLLRADMDHPRLSDQSRQALSARLCEIVASLATRQLKDGSWSRRWYLPQQSQREDQWDRLTITGHLVEWMQYLPADLQPDRDLYVRAGRWLIDSLQRLSDGQQVDRLRFCPWTHAVCAVHGMCADLQGGESKLSSTDSLVISGSK